MDTLRFLKESLIDFKNTGSFVPSSGYLAKRLVAPIVPKPKMVVVELGAGTGSVTKHLLRILPADARLVSFEINDVLADKLSSEISDERFVLIRGDAVKLGRHLVELGIEKADYVVSGLPLGNFSRNTRYAIYAEIYANLKRGGTYTQFQYLLANFPEIRRIFALNDLSWEWRNIPPAFVYACKLI